MRTVLAPAAVAVALLTACMVVPRGYMAPPPEPVYRSAPPPPARLLSEGEAADVALRYAYAQGMGRMRVHHANLDGAGRWHVDLRGDRGKDKAKLLIDARTGEVVRAKMRDAD
ncbi:MAG TPA: hypothetical protein VFP50_20100 [Anaeromyxobacteraceae bacterium]|nr:hypothetical protein [Anaeromyxobacteraceae bacterium]